jgi:hypothetical protein
VRADLDAIVGGMKGVGEMVWGVGGNSMTRAAFVEIARYLGEKGVEDEDLRGMTLWRCVVSVRCPASLVIGWPMYLEQAALFLLGAMKKWPADVDVSAEEVMVLLLKNNFEEVPLKTLSWIIDPKTEIEMTSDVRRALRELVVQEKWDGVRAMALQAMSHAMNDDHDGLGLEECIRGFETGGVMPLKEGWITVCGYAARMVRHYKTLIQEYTKESIDEGLLTRYFGILATSSASTNPESTHLATLRSLQTFSPVMKSTNESTNPSALLISPFMTLLLLLSDDDFQIRQLASEITSSILDDYMLYTPMEASEKLAQLIGETFPPEQLTAHVTKMICQTDVRETLTNALNPDETLFAKERENIWRDEVYQTGLYTRILSLCWSRQMGDDAHGSNDELVNWVINGLDAIAQAIEIKDDEILGWTHDIDAFESVMKIFLMTEVLQRYGKATNLAHPLGELTQITSRRSTHEIWLEKLCEFTRPVSSESSVAL